MRNIIFNNYIGLNVSERKPKQTLKQGIQEENNEYIYRLALYIYIVCVCVCVR